MDRRSFFATTALALLPVRPDASVAAVSAARQAGKSLALARTVLGENAITAYTQGWISRKSLFETIFPEGAPDGPPRSTS